MHLHQDYIFVSEKTELINVITFYLKPIKSRKIIDLGPDYMSRAGPVSRAALVRAGPVVM